MILWPLDVRSSSFGLCCCAKGLWLSLCNIDWSGVHFLVVSLPTVLLNCETWRLCDCVTPKVATFAQPSRATFAASGCFRVVVSSRNGAIIAGSLPCGGLWRSTLNHIQRITKNH